MPDLGTSRTWESAVSDWPTTRGHRLLRAYADELNARLVESWLGDGPRPRRLLKTDLFDEAVGSGLYPCLQTVADGIEGIDVSEAVVEAAGDRYPELDVAQADVRDLPYRDASFDCVVSCSTLDHFRTASELESALAELARVLVPGGRLLVTLDNGANPLVAFRNALPWSWLRSVRLVPCYVGRTSTFSVFRTQLRAAGFEIERKATLMHVPRVAVLGLGVLSPLRPAQLQLLLSGERLGRIGTRELTGQFIAALAVKRA
jgi:SAM-dependent methyltransferase